MLANSASHGCQLLAQPGGIRIDRLTQNQFIADGEDDGVHSRGIVRPGRFISNARQWVDFSGRRSRLRCTMINSAIPEGMTVTSVLHGDGDLVGQAITFLGVGSGR